MNQRIDYSIFLNQLLTPAFKEKYHIKSIKKTNVCSRGKGILAPFFEVYARVVLTKEQKAEIMEIINAAYKEYYKTDILPGINILSSAPYVREYKGKYYHLRIAHNPTNVEISDYEIFEVPKAGYEAILEMKRAAYDSEYDAKLVARLNAFSGEAHKEAWKNHLSEKLLDMLLL